MDEQEDSEFMAIPEIGNFQTYPSDLSPINKDSDSKVQAQKAKLCFIRTVTFRNK